MIRRHDCPDDDTLVDEADWPAVITFFGGDGGGTVIAPTWILTAAHTARNIPDAHAFDIAETRHVTTRVVYHPDAEGESTLAPDIALVEVWPPIDGIPPLELYESFDEMGQVVFLFGRGDHGTGLAGVEGTDARLRRVTNRIDNVTHRELTFRFDAPPDCTSFEGVAGPGDSGGPALLRVDDRWLVAGVSSWQDHDDGALGCYGCVEHYARVSPFASWIRAACVSDAPGDR